MAKITYRGGFTGEPVTAEGRVENEYQDGYDTEGGAWSKYRAAESWTPATWCVIRWTAGRRKGKLTTMNKRNIISVEE